jgi:hypothetical protein
LSSIAALDGQTSIIKTPSTAAGSSRSSIVAARLGITVMPFMEPVIVNDFLKFSPSKKKKIEEKIERKKMMKEKKAVTF